MEVKGLLFVMVPAIDANGNASGENAAINAAEIEAVVDHVVSTGRMRITLKSGRHIDAKGDAADFCETLNSLAGGPQ